MSWRNAVFALVSATGLFALAGCGFHPLYGENSLDPAVRDELATIRVDPIKDRQGQLLRNDLVTMLTPHGEPAIPRYHLLVLMTNSEGQEAISSDTTSTRDVQTVSVSYRLFDGDIPILAGNFNDVYSFNFLPQHYSNIAAADEVRRDAGTEIANELRARIATYFIKAHEAKNAAVSSKSPSGGGENR